MCAERFQGFAHRAEPVSAGVEDCVTWSAGCADAHLGEIIGVDELLAVVAPTEHEDVGAVGNPLEQDPEDAQPAVTEDRPRSNDGDVEPLRCCVETGPLGIELGEAVDLHG